MGNQTGDPSLCAVTTKGGIVPSAETAAALIAGASGLGGGVLGTFFGPWVKWRYENRIITRADRKERIAEWREGIEALRLAEKDRPVLVHETDLSDTISVRPRRKRFVPQDHPDLAVATTKSWFVTLKPLLCDRTLREIAELEKQPLSQRKHAVSDYLAKEVASVEQHKWQLV